MLRQTYSQQKERTKDEVWSEAKRKAEDNHQHPTAGNFVEQVTRKIKQSDISISEDYVPIEFDEKRDEVYFSRQKIPQMGGNNESIWFVTDTDSITVRHRLSVILESFDLNLGIVTSKAEDNGEVRYEITVPFITNEERQERIREDCLEFARQMRDYKDIDEDDIVGDCPNDGCDGKQYRDGMGSCGPRYKCTRFGCSFKFVKNVL